MKLFGKYDKSELEDLIFVRKLSYREIGKLYGVSDTYIKKICNKVGISLEKRKTFPTDWTPHNKGTAKVKVCEYCKTEFIVGYSTAKFCSKICESNHKIDEKYTHYLNNQELYCNNRNEVKFLKRHILREQSNRCSICGNENIWNDKPIVFVLDHIDGNASNNMRKNLRLVCPNCDSQLDTFKSKNKNSARKERYLLNYKNK